MYHCKTEHGKEKKCVIFMELFKTIYSRDYSHVLKTVSTFFTINCLDCHAEELSMR